MYHLHFLPLISVSSLSCIQNLKQQYYTGYTENEVLEVMQHMAKNVVKVNENLTKFIVSTRFLSHGKHGVMEVVCVFSCHCTTGLCASPFVQKAFHSAGGTQ